MSSSSLNRQVVLWGIGHTNALVVRAWRDAPIPEVRLVCVSDAPISTYSGMLPGVLAGQYRREQMQIDLAALCESAGARFIQANVAGIDLDARRLLFADRPPIQFDALSIGIGSVPSRSGVAGADDNRVVSIKPMSTFLDRLRERLMESDRATRDRAIRMVVVGGGTGGAEIAFCLPPFVRRILGDHAIALKLIHDGDTINAGSTAATNDLVQRRLRARGLSLEMGSRVTRIEPGRVILGEDRVVEADLVVWATGAAAPPILTRLGLPVDDRGFLLTRPSMQTLADAPIFVVGDSGTIGDSPTPKAGVHAVRQGPILRQNLARLLGGRPLRPYRPQARFLRLINTGDGRAIGDYLGLTFEGRWCWWLKDWIDRRFVGQFAPKPPNR